MSLGIAIKAPEGIVLAAESRVTLQVGGPGQSPILNHFDNATKIFDLKGLNDFVGVVTWGMAAIAQRPAHSFLPELEASLKAKGWSENNRRTVQETAQEISEFYLTQWEQVMPPAYTGPSMTFLVSGFNETEPYGRVYVIDIPQRPTPDERSIGQEFGMTWGGQHDIVYRILQGYDPRLISMIDSSAMPEDAKEMLKGQLGQLSLQVPFNVLALQDCVELALFFIRSTIEAQELTVGVRGCGGPVDIATITRRRGLRYVQRKPIHGDSV